MLLYRLRGLHRDRVVLELIPTRGTEGADAKVSGDPRPTPPRSSRAAHNALAHTISAFTEALKLERYPLYVFDYGAGSDGCFPAPQLPAQTARRPVTWASAAAAKAPASSCERDEGIQAVTDDPVHARDAGLTEDLD